jgi:hypothetical protein
VKFHTCCWLALATGPEDLHKNAEIDTSICACVSIFLNQNKDLTDCLQALATALDFLERSTEDLFWLMDPLETGVVDAANMVEGFDELGYNISEKRCVTRAINRSIGPSLQ